MTDPLAERLYALMRKQPITCCWSDAEDVAADVRAFLAERVTRDRVIEIFYEAKVRAGGGAPLEMIVDGFLALLRREIGTTT